MQDRDAPIVTHWGSYTAQSRDGEIVSVVGAERDPQPSAIGQNLVGALRNRSRITAPAVRVGWLEGAPSGSGRRGGDSFVEVGWDEAFDLAAMELDRVRRDHGNAAIFGGSYGWGSAGRFHHAQSQVHRFLNAIGGYTRSVNTYSHAAEEVVLPRIVGDREWFLSGVPRWVDIHDHTDVVVAFGGLPARSTQVSPGGVGAHVNADWQEKCERRGVEFILISPMRDESVLRQAQWVPVRPNTDAAMMLALTHWLIDNDAADWDFVERCCVGGDFVRAYVLGHVDGQAKDARWASEICGVPAEVIESIAARLVGRRSLVTVTWALQRQHHGEMNYWAAFTLAAVAGSMGFPGGGVGTGYSSMHNAHVVSRVSAAAALPQLEAPIRDFIPVARIADMLLNPGGSFDYDGSTHRYPDVRLVYWIGGNPFHHHQDLNRLLTAWEKPETVIVHEPYWTATAKRADIVFPVALPVERADIAIGMGDPWLQWMAPVADPPRGVLTDYGVFAELAKRLGASDRFTENRDQSQWIMELYGRTVVKCADLGFELPNFEEFVAQGAIRLPLDQPTVPVFAELRLDPERHPLRTPSGRVELYSETVASFGYADCPGHAAWLEPMEWLGSSVASRFPLHLISHQPDRRLHSQLDFGVHSVGGKVDGREKLGMSDRDARDRGLVTGSPVRVFNDRGACLAVVDVRHGLSQGVVQLATGAWFDPLDPTEVGSVDKGGNPNVLTPDIGTSSLAQGPSAHTCLVEVEPVRGTLPLVTSHDPPALITTSEHKRP